MTTRYDKDTLGPGCMRGRGVRAWMRWNRRHRDHSIKIKTPEKYMHSFARAGKRNEARAAS